MKQILKYIIPVLIATFVVSGLVWAASSFPTSLDSLSTISTGEVITETYLNNITGAINNLETKVGVDNSTVATSLDYYVKSLLLPWSQATSTYLQLAGGTLTDTLTGTELSLTYGFTAASSTITNATTTNLSITGITAGAVRCLQIDSAGNVQVASDACGTPTSDGGSNWVFSGANAITPTSTVGIIVSASSTVNNLTIGNDSSDSFISNASSTFYATSTFENMATFNNGLVINASSTVNDSVLFQNATTTFDRPPLIDSESDNATSSDFYSLTTRGFVSSMFNYSTSTTWSRASGIDYQNTTSTAMLVVVSTYFQAGSGGEEAKAEASIGNTTSDYFLVAKTSEVMASETKYSTLTFIVPINYYYKVVFSTAGGGGSSTLQNWVEYTTQ